MIKTRTLGPDDKYSLKIMFPVSLFGCIWTKLIIVSSAVTTTGKIYDKALQRQKGINKRLLIEQ